MESNALQEVWKWKEEVGESLMNLTIPEKLERIRERARTRLASRKHVITAPEINLPPSVQSQHSTESGC